MLEKMSEEKMLEVIKAYIKGRTIQAIEIDDNDEDYWFDVIPLWNFAVYNYRVKPREIWVSFYTDGKIAHAVSDKKYCNNMQTYVTMIEGEHA
jgi:hypothetical protein